MGSLQAGIVYGMKCSNMVLGVAGLCSASLKLKPNQYWETKHAFIAILPSQPRVEHLLARHLTDYNLDTIVRGLESKDFKNLFELAETISSMKFS